MVVVAVRASWLAAKPPSATAFSFGSGRRTVTNARFDFVQGGDAFALKITASGFGENRLRHKTILYPQRLFHCRAEILLNLTHTGHTRTIILNRHSVNAHAFYFLTAGNRLSSFYSGPLPEFRTLL
jgi:hypothetical protein